jgi:uncharacterized protein YdeI (YjbR/CyaY-like superfamily)
MASTDPRVDTYIAKAEPFARPVLAHLRSLVHQACPKAEETIKWGMPSFSTNGRILCMMAAFKAHCALTFWHKEMKGVLAKDGTASDRAMGSFGRIESLKDLPSDRAMKSYLRQAAKLNEGEAPARTRPARTAVEDVSIPADLTAAMKRSSAARKTLESFTPGQRKEYIEWITGAKRDETRQRRVATAVEWLAEGKKLNWRYEKC